MELIVIGVILCIFVLFLGWSLGAFGGDTDSTAQTVVNTNSFLESFLQKGGFLGGGLYLLNKRQKRYKKKR